jgi:hypothetical protein
VRHTATPAEKPDPLVTAARYTQAIEANDWRAIAELWSPDLVMWNNLLMREIGFDEALEMQKSMHERVKDIRITNIRRVRTEDGYVHQAVFNACAVHSGRSFSAPYMFVAKLDEQGRIVREDEYFTTHLLSFMRDVKAFQPAE